MQKENSSQLNIRLISPEQKKLLNSSSQICVVNLELRHAMSFEICIIKVFIIKRCKRKKI